MRDGMWVHILLNNLASSPLQHGCYFWHRRSKCCEKAVNFILRYLSLKCSCNEIIKTIGLILQRDMFGVTNVLFLLIIVNMCKKADELIRTQQIATNELIRKLQRPAQRVRYVRSIHDKLDFAVLKQCYRLRRKSTSKKN